MLQALHLPAPFTPPAKAPGARGQAAISSETEGRRPDPSRQRLLAERAVLQLAWIGLLAVREGFTCPAEAEPFGMMPPEAAPETVEACLDPDIGDRAIAAYQKASALTGPKAVQRIDTHA